jgi:hypothetical protein
VARVSVRPGGAGKCTISAVFDDLVNGACAFSTTIRIRLLTFGEPHAEAPPSTARGRSRSQVA